MSQLFMKRIQLWSPILPCINGKIKHVLELGIFLLRYLQQKPEVLSLFREPWKRPQFWVSDETGRGQCSPSGGQLPEGLPLGAFSVCLPMAHCQARDALLASLLPLQGCRSPLFEGRVLPWQSSSWHSDPCLLLGLALSGALFPPSLLSGKGLRNLAHHLPLGAEGRRHLATGLGASLVRWQ